MGLFGASLDVGKYEEADRERRLLILAEAVLKTACGTTWLAASIDASSLSGMCTMPSFPATAVEVAGQRKQPWEVIVSGLVWAINPVPKGMINPPGNSQGQNLCAKSRPRAPLGRVWFCCNDRDCRRSKVGQPNSS